MARLLGLINNYYFIDDNYDTEVSYVSGFNTFLPNENKSYMLNCWE